MPRMSPPSAPLLERSDRILGSVWAVVAVPAATLSVLAVSQADDPSTTPGWPLWTLAALGVVLVILMPVAGFIAGRSPRAFPRIAVAAGVIWGSLMVGYALSMTASSGPASDDAAGAGLVILGIPTAFVVASLVGVGALARLALDAFRHRSQSSA